MMIQGAGRTTAQRVAEEHTFGSKAFNELHHGRNNRGGRGAGTTRAEREKKHRARLKRDEAEFIGAKREEWEKEGGHTSGEPSAERRAFYRVLADGSHALKIARPAGNFTAQDVQAIQQNGWTVHPAGTSPAKVGAALPAHQRVDLNPSEKPMTRREAALAKCRIAGYHGDHRGWAEAYTEARISRKAADDAWMVGDAQRAKGISCSCWECKRAASVNPGPGDLERILGPEGQARALVVAGPVALTHEAVNAWRQAGYDVSPAPKRLRQGAKVNPEPVVQKRLYEALKKVKGAPRSVEELASVTGLAPSEALASLQRLESLGLAHPAGVSLFGPLWAPGAPSPALFALNPAPEAKFIASQAFWEAAGVEPGPIVANLTHLVNKRLSKPGPPAFTDEEGARLHIAWVLDGQRFHREKGGAVASWLFIREDDPRCVVIQLQAFMTDHGRGYRILSAYTLRMAQLQKVLGQDDKTAPGAVPGASGRLQGSRKPGSQGLPSGQASRSTVKDTPAGKTRKNPTPGDKGRQRAPMEGTRENWAGNAESMPVTTPTARAREAQKQPSTAPRGLEGLEKAWERWTGAPSGARLTLNLKDRGTCPAAVVLLGRVAALVTKGGQMKDFGAAGPFMVTDADMERVWLIDAQTRTFSLDLTGGLIVYQAKKPKFGDTAAVKYVHLFTGKTRAQMAGNAGELTGAFRLTPRGIEG